MADITFKGADFMLDKEDISSELFLDLLDCGGSGDAMPAVQHVLATYGIAGDPDECRAYLRGYGAWEEEELEDHPINLSRLVWLTGCSLAEGEEAYFSTY